MINDGSDDCDYNFGTFDASLMSRYMREWKRAKKFGQGPPPPFWAMAERKRFFPVRCSLTESAFFVFRLEGGGPEN